MSGPAGPVLALVAAIAAGATVALMVPGRVVVPHVPGPRTAGTVEDDRRERAGSLRGVPTVAVAVGVLFFLGTPAGPPVAVAAAAVCWWLTGRMEPPGARRRRERLVASVPHAVDLMAACLAAGLSPSAALEQVTAVVDQPLSGELAGVSARLRLGVDPATVWRDLSAHPQLGGLGRTIARAVESGASVADAMQRLAEDQRRRHRAAVETRARAVGVQAALPLGGCLLPAFVLVGVVPLVAGSVSVLLR